MAIFTLITAWLINPWLGILGSIPAIYRSPKKKIIFLTAAVLIALTVILYQLFLPIPTDLENTRGFYLLLKNFPEWRLPSLAKDPLSYGILNLLSLIFPNLPISFYLVSTFLNFAILWRIFDKESQQDTSVGIQMAFFFALFLGVIDYSESHHFIRQNTGFLIFYSAFYFNRFKKGCLILLALLWHGSLIVLAPSLLTLRFLKSKKSLLLFILAMTPAALFFSHLNIYTFFKSNGVLARTFEQFTLLDRFLTYFQDPRFEIFFNSSLAVGNEIIVPYLLFSSIILTYSLFRNTFSTIVIHFILVLTLLTLAFQHHVLVFPRLTVLLSLCQFLFLALQIQHLKLKKSLAAVSIVFLLCLLKLHFYIWPIETRHKGNFLYLLSPVKILREYSSWDIMKPL